MAMDTNISSVKSKIIIVITLIVVAIITTINPVYPNEQFLQHMGTLLISLILVVDLKRNKLKLAAFIAVALFILIHIIGARWIYSFVPYEDWLNTFFGWDLNSPRNHYDRFVHFSFGILFFPYLYGIFSTLKIKNVTNLIFAWALVQSFSVFYEVFEWMLTLINGDIATDYNGQQGDVWDAQKDMALAMLGSTLTALYYLVFKRKK
jgi:putative membrane protein